MRISNEKKLNSNSNDHSARVTISNRLGMHARAAAKLVQICQEFEADVTLEKDGEIVDAKSVISLLTLECPIGTEVTVSASGPDSADAVNAVRRLIEDKFGEE